MPPTGAVHNRTEDFAPGSSWYRAGMCVCACTAQAGGAGGSFQSGLVGPPHNFPNCCVFLSQHQEHFSTGGWEDVGASIWKAGKNALRINFCLRKAQGSQYFPSVTCLSLSPHLS